MSSTLLDPLVRERDDGLQLSYQLPHRVYDATVYPIKAPNDSTIIIYGYDLGIKILWRGGRKYKPQQPPPAGPAESKTNGAKDADVIMISDSDEEEEASPPDNKEETAAEDQFEEEDEEEDPTRPFPNVLRSVDIPLGAKVLSLAVPNVSPEAAPSSLESFPPVLSSTVVVAASCADSSTRLIALPIAPPADDAASEFQTATVDGGSVQNIPAGAAITFTNGNYHARSQSHGRTRQSSPAKKVVDSWELLLATHSLEAIGTLSIYRIPLVRQAKNVYAFSRDPIVPFQQQLLPSPANGVSFIPSQYPSDRHAHLLVSFPSGHVKIYSCLCIRSRKPGADRRPSSRDSNEPRGFEAKWLITLSTDFDPTSPSGRRKSIVDAKWVLGGKGIMVLQSDGEWGIWDIENTGTDHSPRSFAVTGRVFPSEQSTKPQQHLLPSTSTEPNTKFAPMTPSTRRVREDALFKGAAVTAPQHHATTLGGIAVKRANIPWDQPWDETVLIWHGDRNVQIPSLLSFWRNSARTPATVESSSRSKPVAIEGISLYGQNQNGICYLPNYSKFSSSSKKDDDAGPNILLLAEYQLILLTLNHVVKDDHESNVEHRNFQVVDDEARLRRGELDINGMDRMLASMSGSSRPTTSGEIRLFS